ncbi:hypothetical protein [uncultured Maribacter sp.]|uniref:hypothetical protein n=1 Tax=uncultured Maribacter sp. TaxID=431308 RepID=UPI0026040210|nr:hypothetical protein [uncultured Maribacter sp.]
MDTKKIEEIVRKVFTKAKTECISHSRYALSNHIGEKTTLSSKTLERAYNRYINNKGNNGALNPESINLLCKYLGYLDYEDYMKSAPKKLNPNPSGISKNYNWKLITIYVGIVFGVIALVTLLTKSDLFDYTQLQEKKKCMTWVKTHYEEVSCSKKFGSRTEPIDPIKLANFKKEEVTMATEFFDEITNQPRIWYYKNKKGEIEYYTAPGLHPVNGETLKKITTGIINKYVPTHTNNMSSFLQKK